MTTKRVPKAKSATIDPVRENTWRGFANITLTDAHKTAILRDVESEGWIEKCLVALIDEGFKVSISFDLTSECYNCMATGTAGAPMSMGYATSSRSLSLANSIAATAYKVIEIAAGDLSAYATEKKSAAEI